MKTIRRDALKRKIAAGKMQAKCELHLTDDYRNDVADNFGRTEWLAARFSADNSDFVDGVINFREYHFTGKSGSAYVADEATGEIRLRVHSNLSYTLREIK